MFRPPLDLLREAIHPALSGCTATLLKRSSTPAAVYRLALAGAPEGKGAPRSVIVKRIAPDWPDDPHGHEREVHLYAEVLPALGAPRPRCFFAGAEPETRHHLLVLEDLAPTHRLLRSGAPWPARWLPAILRAYAHLHHAGANTPLDAPRLFPPYEERVRATAGGLPGMVAQIEDRVGWRSLPRLPALIDATLREIEHYASAPRTLVHNDVTPANVALSPREPLARLLDWEMAGPGLAEMDLAFLLHQPYGNHSHLDRDTVLACYWHERARLGGPLPTPADRVRRQQYAERLLSLWLLPVAHRMAVVPPVPHSHTARYWHGMWRVLDVRLHALCEALP